MMAALSHSTEPMTKKIPVEPEELNALANAYNTYVQFLNRGEVNLKAYNAWVTKFFHITGGLR